MPTYVYRCPDCEVEVKEWIRTISPKARILATQHGQAPVGLALLPFA